MAINMGFFIKTAILTLIWAILREEFTLFTIGTGVVISVFVMIYSHKFIPLRKIRNISFFRLIPYFFYLIGQIYLAGINVIVLIMSGKVRAEFATIRSKLTSETLKVILSDSITLTPGTIMIDLTGDEITVVQLRRYDDPPLTDDNAEEEIKGTLEYQLLKVQVNKE